MVARPKQPFDKLKIARKTKRIKDLPLTQRPREKLLAKGKDNLTDAELLALLLGTGTKRLNAVQVSENLLRKYPLAKLPIISATVLAKIPGVGIAKATRIVAALELGERIFNKNLSSITIRSAEDVLEQVRDIVHKKQEYMIVLYVNARQQLIEKEVIGLGNLNTAIIEPKEVFAPAISTPCAGIIIVHNHPSGDPTPSDDDIQFTRRIMEAGKLLGIQLLDHVIVSQKGYFSIKEDDIPES